MSDYIKHKEYKMPNGRTVTAYFDELGCAKITIQAMDALFDMLNSSEQQWTPCSERLPDENEDVLLSVKYTGHLSNRSPFVEEGFLTRKGWYSIFGDNYNELLVEVIAWMPLPEPYKGETE